MKKQEKQSAVMREFSRFAHTYSSHSEIQKKVASTLISYIPMREYRQIIDIGSGSGNVYQYLKKRGIFIEKFIALDASKDMLVLHPDNLTIDKICKNFDSIDAFENINIEADSLLLSSSALQWSKDLDTLLRRLSCLSQNAYFAIFTANTFKTLHQTVALSSPIYSTESLQRTIQRYYHATFELQAYKLQFNTTREMLQYIKKSGVSGGEKKLNYKDIKILMHTYPLDYLEFEVLLVKATSLTC